MLNKLRSLPDLINIFFILIVGFLGFLVINKPFNFLLGNPEQANSIANSYPLYLLLIAIPRLIFSSFLAVSISIYFKKIRRLSKVNWLLRSQGILVLSLIFFALIFPKKALTINIPTVTENGDLVYYYSMPEFNCYELDCKYINDQSAFRYGTNSEISELVSYYSKLGYVPQILDQENNTYRLKNGVKMDVVYNSNSVGPYKNIVWLKKF